MAMDGWTDNRQNDSSMQRVIWPLRQASEFTVAFCADANDVHNLYFCLSKK